jgi:hypothetical protein
MSQSEISDVAMILSLYVAFQIFSVSAIVLGQWPQTYWKRALASIAFAGFNWFIGYLSFMQIAGIIFPGRWHAPAGGWRAPLLRWRAF